MDSGLEEPVCLAVIENTNSASPGQQAASSLTSASNSLYVSFSVTLPTPSRVLEAALFPTHRNTDAMNAERRIMTFILMMKFVRTCATPSGERDFHFQGLILVVLQKIGI